MAVPDPPSILALPDSAAWESWLSANHAPAARAAFDALSRTERYLILMNLARTRTPESRARFLVGAVGKRAGG